MDDLSSTKIRLFDALGDHFKSYLRLLKTWFQRNLTKEEFDFEARKLLSPQTVAFHNQFIVSLFNKCLQLPSTSSVQKTNANDVKSERDDCGGNKRAKRKAKTVKVTYEHRFFPANVSEYTLNPYKRSKLNEDGSPPIIPSELRLVFCTGEGTLPDHFMANLRILVGVWELELDDVQDEAIALLNLAVRDFMKNIITAMLTFKSSFRSYDNGKFRYAFGVPPLNPYLKNASSLVKYPQYSHSTFTDESGEHCAVIPPTTEFAEHEAMTQIACSFNSWNQLKSGNGKREEEDENKITLWHLFHALRIHKSVIPSHSVYAVNMERIITRLWHEDSECGNEFS